MEYNYDDLITNYVKNEHTQYAIMLDSWWGSGKTYYIKNKLQKHLKETDIVMRHISLFNISSLQQITKQLIFESNKDKKITVIKSIGGLFIKGFSESKLNINLDDLPLLNLINFEKKLIVLDDLERSNLDIITILGYVSDLVENYNAKVLLVCNEEEIINRSIYSKLSEAIKFVDEHKEKFFSSDKDNGENQRLIYSLLKPADLLKEYINDYKSIMYSYDEYNLYKEKVIYQTLKFSSNLKDSYDNLIQEYFSNEKSKKIMVNPFYKEIIVDQFNQNEKINLRTVIFSFDILHKILVFFEEKIFELSEYRNTLIETYLREVINIVSWYKSREFVTGNVESSHRNHAIWQYIQESNNPNYKLLKDAIETGNFADNIYKNILEEYNELVSVVAVDLFKFNQFTYNEGDIQRKREIIKDIYQKLDKNKISINMYLEIFRSFHNFEISVGDKENYKKLYDTMINNLDTSNQLYKQFRSFAIFNRGEISKEYREYEEKLLNKLEGSKYKVISKVFNESMQEDNWIGSIRAFSETNNISYSNLNKFLSFFNFDNLYNKIIESDIKTIIEFRRFIQEVYSYSNLNMYFIDDKEIIKKIINQIDSKTSVLNEDKKLHLAYLQNDLEDILSKIAL